MNVYSGFLCRYNVYCDRVVSPSFSNLARIYTVDTNTCMRYCKYFYFDYQINFDSHRIQSELYINFIHCTVQRDVVQFTTKWIVLLFILNSAKICLRLQGIVLFSILAQNNGNEGDTTFQTEKIKKLIDPLMNRDQEYKVKKNCFCFKQKNGRKRVVCKGDNERGK